MKMSTSEEKTAKEKLRAQAEQLRDENEEVKEREEKNMEVVKNQLAAIAENKELASMYNDSAKMGSENLGGDSPQLKVHAVGKSHSNELSEGGEPNDGWFFYKPTGEQFPTIDAHIITISRGFRAEGLEDRSTGKKKMVFNQIMGGVFGPDYKPFVVYVTGNKLSNMWDFAKAARKYTRAKPIAIPMFALTVKLSTEKVKTDFGPNWVINFTIEKNEDGSPVLITDPGEFDFLRNNVSTTEDIIESIISAKEKPDEEEQIAAARPIKYRNAADVMQAEEVPTPPEEEAGDIPW